MQVCARTVLELLHTTLTTECFLPVLLLMLESNYKTLPAILMRQPLGPNVPMQLAVAQTS